MARRRGSGSGVFVALVTTLIKALTTKPRPAAAASRQPRRQRQDADERPPGEVIRFDAPPRDTAWRRIFGMEDALVGEQHHRVEIIAFAAGTGHAVEVVREPWNPQDPHALAVFGAWDDSDGERCRGHLGYVPRDLAAAIAATRPADLPIRAWPTRLYRRGDYLDLNVALLEPSARSDYWKALGGAPAALTEPQS